MTKCKHKHECEQCVRAEIKKHEDIVTELKKKLPAPQVVYINQYHPNHNVQLSLLQQYMNNGVTTTWNGASFGTSSGLTIKGK